MYDVNNKTFLFKFHKPDEKFTLLIESGIRIHTTEYVRDKSTMPSNFNIKLRKHLKTRRLISLKQIQNDRRIDMQFGEEEYAFHLILEFFATGNIILTDHEYKIMSLMRVVEVDEETPIAVGQIYQLENRQEHPPINPELLSLAIFNDNNDQQVESPVVSATKNFNKKKTRKKVSSLRNVLRTALGPRYGPSLVDHAIAQSINSPDLQDFSCFTNQSGDEFKSLLSGFQESDSILEMKSLNPKGYIMAEKFQKDDISELTFDDFAPFKPAYYQEGDSKQLLEFDSFDRAVDEYFSKVETQKLQQKARQAEQQAIKKLEAVKENSANQIKSFQISQERKELMALAIECNLDLVDSAIKTICSFVASGMDWGDLKELVKEEQEKGNPLAKIIKDLKLNVGMITLSLPDPNQANTDESDDDEEADTTDEENDSDTEELKAREQVKANIPSRIAVDVDIYSTAYANATNYYGAKKLAIEKGKKTLEASVRQLELAEKKIMQKLEKKETNAVTISRYRPPYWFEKFIWFLSSGKLLDQDWIDTYVENYLVVGGRDAQQTELLVTKYLKKGDFYVTADIDGSASVIVKKLDANAADIIPPTTLLQAGTMAICHSKAWESKIVTSAFWVHQNQVTKLSFAGDSLPVGVFNIKGKKNYLPPVQLVYGIGLLFQVADECIERHYLERRPWARDGGGNGPQETIEMITMAVEQNLDDDVINQTTLAMDDEEEEGALDDAADENVDNEVPVEKEFLDMDSQSKDLEVNIENNNESEDNDEEGQDDENGDGSTVSSPSTSNAPKLGRGRKSKLKKLKQKYADQDEEDRQLALEFLGSGKGPQPKGKKAKAEAEKRRLQAERSKVEKEKREAREKQAANRKANTPKTPKTPCVPLSTEDFIVPDLNLDNLTGIPHESDSLLYCIPVCAPWTTLQKYKYRVKLLPGSLKRGKAAKSAQHLFEQMAVKGKWTSELEVIKQINEPEWINSILGKVKLGQTKV